VEFCDESYFANRGCCEPWVIPLLTAQICPLLIAPRPPATASGAGRRLEIRPIPVTLPTLPQSIPQTRALRDATPLGGWTAPVPGLGTGREKEGGSLELAWNWLGTPLLLQCCSGATTAFLRPLRRRHRHGKPTEKDDDSINPLLHEAHSGSGGTERRSPTPRDPHSPARRVGDRRSGLANTPRPP
jgi:hypothetical protein